MLAQDAAVDFARDVRPILATACVRCHGPDVQRKSLRLDDPVGALRGGRSGPAIVPGRSRDSLLMQHVTGQPGKRRMPAEGPPLSHEQIDVLRRWIDGGAQWPAAHDVDLRHWAYRRIGRPTPPDGDAATPIDRFVDRRLAEHGARRSDPTAPALLLRRVYLDLTGLPPDPADVIAFESDARPDAYERVVERLLDSPAFAEHWAAFWLDLARYADTRGYEKDDRRSIWRYRDWVVAAFERGMPFDEFTVQQLAGDLLPDPTPDQLLATAFHRNTMTNDEGGTDDEEFRVAAVIDRVNTTFEVWLGTTLACAQCHDHKYDPISQREYFELFAFFDQSEDNDRGDDAPTIETPTDEQRRQIDLLDNAIRGIDALIDAPDPSIDEDRRAWERARTDALAALALEIGPWQHAGPFRAESFDAAFQTAFAPERGEPAEWAARPEWDDARAHPLGPAPNSAHYLRRALRSARGGEVTLSFGSDDAVAVWLDGRPLLARRVSRAVGADQEQATVELPGGTSELLVKIVNGGGPSGFWFAARPLGLPRDTLEALRAGPESRTAEHEAALVAAHRAQLETFAPLRAAREELSRRRAAIEVPRTPIMRELPPERARTTRVHVRGSFLSPGDVVTPATPSILHAWPAGEPRNRLGLARWITSPDNPLTARVIVNRLWQRLFGVGLVATSEDFGTQGDTPSHPELLDWLARSFIDGGFRTKDLLRTIVTSATYRQSSDVRDELAELDPANRLLWRGARLRLRAEAVRDQALVVGGLLDATRFGPSVMPPQPDGVWQVVYSADQWITSSGGDRFRRGLYTFWRRTSPYPAMVAFDAPSREFCVVSRDRSNTPLQALVTLNDSAFVDAARGFARRILREASDDGARIEFAFRACVARAPETAESTRLRELLDGERTFYRQMPGAAEKLAAFPDAAANDRTAATDPAELAAWTVVANVLLNLDETIARR